MLLIPRRQIWTQQPQTHTAIAPEYSALAPRLIVNYGGSPNDLVSGKSPVAINRSYAADSKGLGLKGTSGVAQYASRLTGKYLTLVISVTPGVYAGMYQMLFETEVATTARTEGSLMVLPYYDNVAAASGWWSVSLSPSDGVNYTYGIIKFPAPSANIPHTLVVRVDRNLTGPAKVLSVHVDGMAQVLTPSGTNNTQGSNSNFNANNLYINQRAGGAIPGAHNVHFVGVFGSLFSSEKAKSLSDNPWQILAPRETHIFVPVSAGGGSTLNAAATGGAVAGGSASLAAQVALSGVGVSTADGSATAAVSIPLAAAGFAVSSGTASAVATVTVSAAGLAQAAGTANLSGGAAGSIGATGQAQASGSALLNITVTLNATGSSQSSGSANLSGGAPGQVAASGGAQAGGSAQIKATVSISAAGYAQAMASGQLSIQIPLSAFGGAISAGSAHLVDVGGSLILTRAPAGQGPIALPADGYRPQQSSQSRPGNTGGRRL